MPTIGRVIASARKVPLKQFVEIANGGGRKMMKPSGALTKAGRAAYAAEKAKMGLPKNASIAQFMAAVDKQVKSIQENLKKLDIKKIDVDVVGKFKKTIKDIAKKSKEFKLPEGVTKELSAIKDITKLSSPKKLVANFSNL